MGKSGLYVELSKGTHIVLSAQLLNVQLDSIFVPLFTNTNYSETGKLVYMQCEISRLHDDNEN